MSLLIAMPGLPETEVDAPGMRAALPPLPVLSALLARARRLPAALDWRAGVMGALAGGAGTAAIPAAAVAARAVPALPAGSALCFAEPLHVVAGISRMHLPPGGQLHLQADEADAWMESFNREIGGPELHLHATAGGWLLASPCAQAARDPAPETLIGQPLARVHARDEAERALRRLGAETEMWLAAHSMNRAREARQLLPINSLWFWGGARVLELPRFLRPPRAVYVAGEPDAWLAGLAAHCAVPLVSAPGWQALTSTSDALLLLLPPAQGATMRHWQELETKWFEPAARVLREGAVGALRLQIGASAWQLPDRSPLRWLRRRRPWYEQVRA